MLNVNDGHSSDLMNIRTLKEYAQYVVRVRKYGKQDVSLEEAVMSS